MQPGDEDGLRPVTASDATPFEPDTDVDLVCTPLLWNDGGVGEVYALLRGEEIARLRRGAELVEQFLVRLLSDQVGHTVVDKAWARRQL